MILASAPKEGPSIQYMKERHQEIKRRLVAGDLAVDISRSLGVTQSWLSIIINSPVFIAELAKESALADQNAADVAGRIKRLAPDAMSILEAAIRKKREETNLSLMQQVYVARDVLDRSSFGKPVAPQNAPTSIKINIVQFSSPVHSDIKTQTIIEHQAEASV